MKALAFPIIVPRFKADGSRNTIDLSSPTLGADIQALLTTATDAQERFYPFPRVENATFDRTDTVYETAPSTRKYKIDGVGGVRTFNFELWAKDAVHQILRELQVLGCSEVDFYLVDITGNLWGIKDSIDSNIIRGYEMATETFDAFKMYATDTTVQKIMTSWDLDNAEAEENSYAITAEELGYKATSLKGNISGYQTLTAVLATELQSIVFDGFGSAADRGDIIGLLLANFTVYNETAAASVTPSGVVETSAGTYTITIPAQTTADILRVEVINAAGYDVAPATVAAL
jgi:hypothetical protein